MNSSHPPELKGFHTKNMIHALAVFMIPALAGGWAFYRQESFSAQDELQSALHWTFMGGVALFMLTILFKALVTVPRCSKCNCKMRQLETITITERALFNIRSETKWRVVECPLCHDRYRIPGLSQG